MLDSFFEHSLTQMEEDNDFIPHVEEKKILLRSRVREFLSSSEKNSLSPESLIDLLDLATSIGADDLAFVRRKLWSLKEIKFSNCKRRTLPCLFAKVFSNLKVLDLSMNDMESFPEAIVHCITLTELSLYRNKISHLSANIGALVNLKKLDVRQNKLECFPMSLSSLISLTHLSCTRNRISTLYLNPDSKKRERHLQLLRERNEAQFKKSWKEIPSPRKDDSVIYYNVETGRATNTRPNFSENGSAQKTLSFPDAVEWEIICGQESSSQARYYNHLNCTSANEGPESLDRFGSLGRLVNFDISHNNLKQLPQSMNGVSEMKEFDAPYNQLKSIESLSKFEFLNRLNLRSNHLKRVPCLTSTLNHLDLSHNYIDEFPGTILELKNLKYLNISSNAIKVIPYELGFLPKMNELDLKDNPIVDPPYSEMIKRTEEVLWICRQSHNLRQRQGDHPMLQHASGISLRKTELSPDFKQRLNVMIHQAASSHGGLDFQFMNLHTVPVQAFHSDGIKRIDLSYNRIKKAPALLTRSACNILTLTMRYCDITDLDSSICFLLQLQRLDLEGNCITKIPDELMDLQELLALNLNKNRITKLPQNIGNLKSLTELNIDNNSLQKLEKSLEKCLFLETLSVEENELENIDSFIFSISSLRRLCMSKNFIKTVPEAIGRLSLIQLSLSSNEIDFLHNSCMCPYLCSTIEVLELNCNKIFVLPHSFSRLSNIKKLNLDMNLLQSPPMTLLNEGTQAILKYCTARSKKVMSLSKQLRSAGFVIDDMHFVPPVSDLIKGAKGFLTASDLKEFDVIVDNSINGAFYSSTQTVEKIVEYIKHLRASREYQCHEKIVAVMLAKIRKLCIRERSSSDQRNHFHRSDIEQSFSMLEDKVKCFAVSLEHVVLPSSTEIHHSSSIFSKMKRALNYLDSLYNFQDDDFFKALKYKSPFGTVSTIRKVQYQQSDGGEPIERISLVIRQVIFSKEEAVRMIIEEDFLKLYYEKMVKFVDDWSAKDGIKSINEEVTRREQKISANLLEAKRALQKISSNLSTKKFTNYEKPYDSFTKNLDTLQEKYKRAKTEKVEMQKSCIKSAALDDLKKKCCFAIFEKVTQHGRAFACLNNLRRPWDETFSTSREDEYYDMEDSALQGKSALVRQLERIVITTQCDFQGMEQMSLYDNKSYEKFQKVSLLANFIKK